MSFREKTAWISLVSIIGIYAFYFWGVFQAGPQDTEDYLDGFMGTIFALVFVQVVLTIAIAFFTPAEAQAPRDELETLIELRATRIAYAGLATGVALACFFGAFKPPMMFNTNSLLFILVCAEVLRSASQIIQYRRAA